MRGGDDAFALLKGKPFVFLEEPEKTVRQMSVELVTWTARSMGKKRPLETYYLISEHRHEAFVTMASPTAEYLEYLREDVRDDVFLEV
ncbi:hypothetical protein AbraIFM66950_005131 [Aspergillus brasiliensis]|nr:hypothetical protein AbraIFM66950_005131 [Aspergillus brasiliensis]